MKSIMSLILLLLMLTSAAYAAQGDRIALVIGNGTYNKNQLHTPPNDVQLMYDTLLQLNFRPENIVLKQNANFQTMNSLITDFMGKAGRSKGGVTLIYFSGHGVEFNGVNYMIPVGESIEREEQVPFQAVSMHSLVAVLAYFDNTSIIILDACRNNPYSTSKGSEAGIGGMNAPPGTLIAFAAEPKKAAKQGKGEYSVFTESLCREITKPNLEINAVLTRVRQSVYKATNKEQLPVVDYRLLGEFYLANPNTALPVPPLPAKEPLPGYFQDITVSILRNDDVEQLEFIVRNLKSGLQKQIPEEMYQNLFETAFRLRSVRSLEYLLGEADNIKRLDPSGEFVRELVSSFNSAGDAANRKKIEQMLVYVLDAGAVVGPNSNGVVPQCDVLTPKLIKDILRRKGYTCNY